MSEFASVLRSWRDRVQPAAVGLSASPDRRAAGLRREELAALAGLSVDYVVRLEQGRATHPSPQVLGSLARALRLTDAERDHLYRVAGAAVPPRSSVPRHIAPGVQRLVDRLGDTALAVFTASWDIVLWNPLWAALLPDPAERSGRDRNIAWQHFTHAPTIVEFDDEHAASFSADLVADLRGALGRYPQDAALGSLIADLRERSAEFETLWGTASIGEHRSSRKTVHSPVVGDVTADCDVLTVPDGDLRIVVYTAEPGSTDAAALDLLRVTGTQALAPRP